MIALTEADDLHEIIRNVARDKDRDMSNMHAIADEILGMPVGDATPTPGSLKAMVAEPVVEPLIVFPPPQHEGFDETINGKFYIPRSAKTEQRVTFRELCRQVRHLRRVTYSCFVALTLFILGALTVIAYRW